MSVLSAFNDHFTEFVNDIQLVFPDDVDILTAKNALLSIRKVNPKLLPKIWIQYVVIPYRAEIEQGNIEFFLVKDYSNDVAGNSKADQILESINRLRDPIRLMSEDNQAKTMKYIQNLSKLAMMIA